MINDTNELENKLDEFLGKALVNYDLPGLAVSVCRHETGTSGDSADAPDNAGIGVPGGFVYRNAVGYRDLDEKKTLRPGDIFHMASVTKLFVGTSILQLWERGRLQLEGKLTDYLPWFRMKDERYREITVRQLLSHTSGMPDIKDYHWDEPETDERALERFVGSSEVTEALLLWGPGEGRFSYSNMGYEILGAVIAAVSGVSFEDYVRHNIFEPLQMKDSMLLTFERGIYDKNGPDENLCTPYEKNNEKKIVKVKHFPYHRGHAPSSTLTSNIFDLEKWARAHFDHSILKKDTYKAAWEKQALVPNNGEHICLSWFRRADKGYVLYGHEGTDDGFRASFWICPERKLSITVCSNISGAPVKKINKQIFDLLSNSGNMA